MPSGRSSCRPHLPGFTTDSQPNVAHFAGVNDARAGMFQSLTIPDGAVTMTLSGQRRITTQEAGSTPLDVLTIQLWEDADTTTGLIGDFAVLSNADATGDWVEFIGTISVDGRSGETLDIDFWAETDSSLITDFYVDSLVLTAYVCLWERCAAKALRGRCCLLFMAFPRREEPAAARTARARPVALVPLRTVGRSRPTR